MEAKMATSASSAITQAMEISYQKLHEEALKFLPEGIMIRPTSFWVALVVHSAKLKGAKVKRDFLFFRCSPKITVRTIKHEYFMRMFLEGFELRFAGKFLHESVTVNDMAQACPIEGSRLLVVRALESADVRRIARFDRIKLERQAKELAEEEARQDNLDSTLEAAHRVQPLFAGERKRQASGEAHDQRPTKFARIQENESTLEPMVESIEVPAPYKVVDTTATGDNAHGLPVETTMTSPVNAASNQPATDTRGRFETENAVSQALSIEEMPATANLYDWDDFMTRLAELPPDLAEPFWKSPLTNCGECNRVMHLKPWTHFNGHSQALCTVCTREFLEEHGMGKSIKMINDLCWEELVRKKALRNAGVRQNPSTDMPYNDGSNEHIESVWDSQGKQTPLTPLNANVEQHQNVNVPLVHPSASTFGTSLKSLAHETPQAVQNAGIPIHGQFEKDTIVRETSTLPADGPVGSVEADADALVDAANVAVDAAASTIEKVSDGQVKHQLTAILPMEVTSAQSSEAPATQVDAVVDAAASNTGEISQEQSEAQSTKFSQIEETSATPFDGPQDQVDAAVDAALPKADDVSRDKNEHQLTATLPIEETSAELPGKAVVLVEDISIGAAAEAVTLNNAPRGHVEDNLTKTSQNEEPSIRATDGDTTRVASAVEAATDAGDLSQPVEGNAVQTKDTAVDDVTSNAGQDSHAEGNAAGSTLAVSKEDGMIVNETDAAADDEHSANRALDEALQLNSWATIEYDPAHDGFADNVSDDDTASTASQPPEGAAAAWELQIHFNHGANATVHESAGNVDEHAAPGFTPQPSPARQTSPASASSSRSASVLSWASSICRRAF